MKDLVRKDTLYKALMMPERALMTPERLMEMRANNSFKPTPLRGAA